MKTLSLAIFGITITAILSLPNRVHAQSTYDLTNSNYWNLKIAGSTTDRGDTGLYSKNFGDLDGNGQQDLLICLDFADYQSRTDSGSCYVIYDTILAQHLGLGQTLDLDDPGSYNIRFDGATAGSKIGYASGAVFADVNGNGRSDILIPAAGAYIYSWGSGAFYVILDEIIDDYSGISNIIDLANSNNFNIRYDGHITGGLKNYISESTLMGADVDNNGVDDIVVGSGHTGLAGRDRSGSLYIIYDSLVRGFTGRGNVVNLWDDASAYNLVYYGNALSYFSLINDVLIKDFDKNGKNDIIVGAGWSDYNGRTDSGSLYYISDDLIDNYSGTTNNQIDVSNTNNFTWRIDGANNSDLFSYNGIGIADLDNNGLNDIAVAAGYSDYNSLTDSGSVYIISDSILSPLNTGVGNTLDIRSSTSYILRIDGTQSSASLGYGMRDLRDFNNDGLYDLIIPSSGSSSIYVLYNDNFASYSTTGNTLSLVDSANYDVQYDGGTGNLFGFQNAMDDFNHDGTIDILSYSYYGDLFGRTNNGTSTLVYNFPHTISATGQKNSSNYTLTGLVTATNSITTVELVEYKIDSGSWQSCAASDGSYNSKSESFSCEATSLTSGDHTISVRARDQSGVYTASSNFFTTTFNITSHQGDRASSSCQDDPTEGSPDLFQINSSSTSATLFFAPPPGQVTKYIVSYGTNPTSEDYGVEFSQGKSGGAISYQINSLKPNTTYYFKVKAANGCKVGNYSQVLKTKTKLSRSNLKQAPIITELLDQSPNIFSLTTEASKSPSNIDTKPKSFFERLLEWLKELL